MEGASSMGDRAMRGSYVWRRIVLGLALSVSSMLVSTPASAFHVHHEAGAAGHGVVVCWYVDPKCPPQEGFVVINLPELHRP